MVSIYLKGTKFDGFIGKLWSVSSWDVYQFIGSCLRVPIYYSGSCFEDPKWGSLLQLDRRFSEVLTKYVMPSSSPTVQVPPGWTEQYIWWYQDRITSVNDQMLSPSHPWIGKMQGCPHTKMQQTLFNSPRWSFDFNHRSISYLPSQGSSNLRLISYLPSQANLFIFLVGNNLKQKPMYIREVFCKYEQQTTELRKARYSAINHQLWLNTKHPKSPEKWPRTPMAKQPTHWDRVRTTQVHKIFHIKDSSQQYKQCDVCSNSL